MHQQCFSLCRLWTRTDH